MSVRRIDKTRGKKAKFIIHRCNVRSVVCEDCGTEGCEIRGHSTPAPCAKFTEKHETPIFKLANSLADKHWDVKIQPPNSRSPYPKLIAKRQREWKGTIPSK